MDAAYSFLKWVQRAALPPLSKLPKRGRVSWLKRYASEGDRIIVFDWHGGKTLTKIAKVQINMFGRVSYRDVDDNLILTEDLVKNRERVGRKG